MPAPPPGFVVQQPQQAPLPPGFEVQQPVDLRRSAQPFAPTPGVTMHRLWWDQNYQRLGLPENPTSFDEVKAARQRFDPEGYEAWERSPQGQNLAVPHRIQFEPRQPPPHLGEERFGNGDLQVLVQAALAPQP